MLHVLIGAGHSGVINGHYYTPGKRSPGKKTEDDQGIFEGEFNRNVGNYLWAKFANDSDMFGELINPGPVSIPMKSKIDFINWYHKLNPNTVYIEIHANAIGNVWQDRVSGIVIFHKNSPDNMTKRLSKSLEESLRIEPLLDFKSRGIKTAKQIGRGSFSILENPTCPSVIVELGSMDNPTEVALLGLPRTCQIFAQALYDGVRRYEP